MNEIMRFVMTLTILALLRFLNSSFLFEEEKNRLIEASIKRA